MIDAIVTGQSLPALQSALDLAEVGLKVAMLPPATSASVEPAAEYDPEGSIAEFIMRIDEPIEPLAQGDAASRNAEMSVRREMPKPPLLYKHGEWLRQSTPEVLGIPAIPLASENIALLGSGGSFRAYLDRITPLMTVGKTRLLGELVRKRMGARVRSGLVDPHIFERFGVVADEVEVAIAAPGLNEALSRAGALSSAVLAYSDRNVARETRVSPAQGWAGFRRAALKRLELYGVEMLESHLISVQSQDDGWTARLSDGSAVRSRALLVDFDRSPVPIPAALQHVEAVLPAQVRVHAIIDMEPPAWMQKGMSALALLDGWSLSYSFAGDSQLSIGETAPKRPPCEYCELRVATRAGDLKELSDLLGQIIESKRLSVASESSGLGLGGDASLRSASLAAAPFCTVARRNEAVSALEQQGSDFPRLLSLGRALHGDDQAVALAAAHRSTVRLRRRLLGLEDWSG